jgi:hypothetical protein
METKTFDITNITDSELKTLLNIEETKTIEVSVDLLHGYYILNYGHAFTGGTHKRFVKDSVEFIKTAVNEFGFEFVSFKDTEIVWSGNSRGFVTFYTVEVR